MNKLINILKELRSTSIKVALVLIFIAVVYSPSKIFGQRRDYTFRQFSINDGLSQNTVQSIFKDHRGFVWIGTYDGLNRFDGMTATVFKTDMSNPYSLLNSVIYCIDEDVERDQLYVATGCGLSVYHPNEDRFDNYSYHEKGNSILSNYAYDIKVAADGKVWIANSYGVSEFDPDTKQFVNYQLYQGDQEDVSDVIPSCVFVTNEGDVWVGSNGRGLIKVNLHKGRHTVYPNLISSNRDAEGNIIHSITEYSDTQFLVATSNGAFLFNKKTGKYSSFLYEGEVITKVIKGVGDDFWIGTKSNGLVHYSKNGKREEFIHNPFDHYSLPDNYVTTLYMDSGEMLWVGTKANGLVMMPLEKNLFTHYYNVPNKNSVYGGTVFALEKDDKGNVYVGTSNGLSRWNRHSDRFEKMDLLRDGKDISIWALHVDRNNILWAGSAIGLIKYNLKDGTHNLYRHKRNDKTSLPSNNVYAIERDSMDRLWIGTNNGLCRLHEGTGKFVLYEAHKTKRSINSTVVWSIDCDSKGKLWISTEGGLGLYNYTMDDFTVIKHSIEDNLSLRSSNITSISEGSQGNIWVATAYGVESLGNSLLVNKHYGEKEGMANGFAYAVVEHNGYLWVSTNKGISRINLINDKIDNFDSSNGVQDKEFSPASLVLDDESILFGGTNGFNVFHPDSLETSFFVPPIYFTGLQIYGNEISSNDSINREDVVMKRSYLTTSKLKLDYKERFLTLDFAALDFKDPGRIQYFYRLLPNSEKWFPLENQRYLTFINLRPGKYELQVRSTNSDGVMCDNVKELSITVVPPVWKTTWFLSLLIATVALAIFLLVKYRLRLLRNEKVKMADTIEKRTYEIQVQRNIANKQRDEIARQKNQLENFAMSLETKVRERTSELEKAKLAAEESDRLKTAFLSNMSHEIRTPMNAIIGFSELLFDNTLNSGERRDFAQMIKVNGDELLHLLNDIIDISMIESGQMKINQTTIWLNEEMNNVYSTFINSKYLTDRENLRFMIEIPEQDMSIKTDAFRLRQVLKNLVSNAIKFTNEGYVKLGYKIVNGKLRFYVEDTGIGISEEFQRTIFERFLKVKNDVSNLYRGNGLGLTISKNLVEILGGKIYLQSKVGEGSNFYFELPLQ